MKNGKNLFYTIITVTGIFLSLLILATCDVGLGSSVDTTPPSVKINNPGAGTVERDEVTVEVDATDDGVVDTVLVTLKELGKIDGTANEYNYKAVLNNGKWGITIDTVHGTKEKDQNDGDTLRPVLDGTYQLVVKVTDAAKRETTQMTTFTVDNTPPVIIVTSPDEKSAKMNFDIQMEGKVYDATDMDKVTVSFYHKTEGALETPVLTKPAELTGTGEWKISFDGEKELRAETDNPVLEDGSYYYVITASDEVGNVSTYFFHKDDIYSVYKKENLASPKKLDSTSWAALDKGDKENFEGLSNESLPEIRIPIDNTVDSTVAGGTRPEIDYSKERFATIKWQNISKHETDSEGNETFAMLNENDSILGSISPEIGVDAPFVNSSFKAYIYETPLSVDEKNKPIGTPSSEYLLDSSMWEITNAGTNRNFKISTRGFEGSLNPYYIYIEITNASGTTYPSQQGFMISLTNPILTIDTPTNMTTKDRSFLIKGTSLISNRREGSDLTYTVKKNGGTESDEIPISVQKTGAQKGYWELALKDEAGNPLGDGTYEFTFTASSQGFTTTKQCTVVLDTTAPEVVSIMQLTQNDNGSKISVTGNADDSLSGFDTANGAEFKYCFVEKETEPSDNDWNVLTNISFYSWKFDIDSSNLPETEHKLYVRITDTAGNMTEKSAAIVIDKTNPALAINEDDNGKWVSNQIQAITGTATDPHFDKLTVKVGDGDAVEIPVNPTTHGWSWQPAAGTADGTYTVVFTATDKYLDDGADNSKSTAITTNFTLDRVKPEIEVQNIENGGVYKKGKDVSSPLEVRSMTTDDLSGIQSIEYKVNDNQFFTSLENLSSNWTVNLKNLPESTNTLYIRATDKAGNTKDLDPITFKTDYSAPTAIFGEISSGENNQDDWENENNNRIETKENIVLTGKVLDAANTDTVTYTFSYSRDDGGTDEISVDSATFNNAAFASKGFTWDNDPESDTYGKWTYNLPTSKGDGTYVFTLSASDIAGNTTKRTRTVLVDTKAPELTVTSPLEDEQITAAYKIAGTIRDDGSKFGNEDSGIFYSFDSGENKNWTRLVVGSSARWETPEISLPAVEGNQYVYVKAVDNLGNTTEVLERPYYYDKAAPVLTETSISIVDIVPKQDTFTLGGTWTETNELKSITITFTKNGGATQNWATIIPAGTETDPKKGTGVAWSREVIVDATDSDTSGEKFTSGLYEFTITAKDDAGKTASLIRRIRIDLVPPEDPYDITINGTSFTNGGVTYYNGELTIGGKASDGGEELAQSGVSKVQYSLTGGTNDNEWTNCNGTTNWTVTIESNKFTEEREYTIYFRAIDGSGLVNTGSVTRTINIDKNNPQGSIGVNGDFSNGIYQTNGTGTDENGNKFVLFSGTADDAYYTVGREALSATLSFSKDNGDSETVTNGFVWDNDPESENFGEWSYKMPVPNNDSADGNYQYTLTVTDRAGKTTTKTKNILLDTAGPVISTSLGNDMSFLSFTNNVTISCFDTHAGLDSSRRLYWRLNDEDEQHLISGSTAQIVFKVQGINQKITFIAYDKLNNKTEVEYTGLTVDT
ncbi:MAG: Ig-like domain repeat protein, partial [Treponemataceae bacterium]|nr:Ig-like domain repeat protein [Treponemataceae bacterium]